MEREFWANECRRSFYWFARIAWGIHWYMQRNRNDQWFQDPVHKPLCDWLQKHVEEWEANRENRRRKKLAVIIPRNFGKTVLVTKALNLWIQVRNPDTSAMIGSEVVTKAEDFFQPVKEVMNGNDPYSWFAWLYGNWYDPDRTWSKGRVVHAARKNVARTEPSFGTWGVDTGITGLHPDVGILDDPLSEEKIRDNGTWIATVNQAVAALRPAFRTDSLFVLVCTRYRDNDVAGTYLRKEGVKSWTGMQTDDPVATLSLSGEWDVYFLRALDHADRTILPSVHPTEELHAYRKAHPVEFSAQMMNEPAQGEHMELTQSQIDELWIDEKDLPSRLRYTMHLDTAFKDDERRGRGDESVIEVWGHDPRGTGDVYFIEGYGSNEWRVEDFTTKFVNLLKKYRSMLSPIVAYTDDEERSGKFGAWQAYLRSVAETDGIRVPRHVPCKRNAGNKKNVRMREALAFWVEGHVHLVKGAPGVEKLIYQILRIGYSAHDDWADCAADVFDQEIYRPFILGLYSAIPSIRQPGDDILKGHISNERALEIYDIQHSRWTTEDEFSRSLSDPKWAR